MPDPLPPGATRCRGRTRNGKDPCPGLLPSWSDPGPDGRIVSQRCTVCGHEYVDVRRDMAGQEIRPEAAR